MTPMIHGEIKTYVASLFSKGTKRAQLVFWSEAAATTCYLSFHLDSATLPEARLVIAANGTKQLYVSLRYTEYSNFVDLLRNEKPVYFFYRDDAKSFYLHTTNEPVGDHELTS